MGASSARVVLGAGVIVLAAQLVVWLTPARNLFVSSAEDPTALPAGGKTHAATQSAQDSADEGKSEGVAVGEPSTASGETVVGVPVLPECEAGVIGIEEPPLTADSEAANDTSPIRGTEAPVPSTDTVAENVASPAPKAKSDTSPPTAGEMRAPAEDAATESMASCL